MSDINTGKSNNITIIPKLTLTSGGAEVLNGSTMQSIGLRLRIANSPFRELKDYSLCVKWTGIDEHSIDKDSLAEFNCGEETCEVTLNDLTFADIFQGGPKELFGKRLTSFNLHLYIENASCLIFNNLQFIVDYTFTLKFGSDVIFGNGAVSQKLYNWGKDLAIRLEDVDPRFADYSFMVIIWEADSNGKKPKIKRNAEGKYILSVNNSYTYYPIVYNLPPNTTFSHNIGIKNNRFDCETIGSSEGGGTPDQFEWSVILIAHKDFEITNNYKSLDSENNLFYVFKDTSLISRKVEVTAMSAAYEIPNPNYNNSFRDVTYNFTCVFSLRHLSTLYGSENNIISIVKYDPSQPNHIEDLSINAGSIITSSSNDIPASSNVTPFLRISYRSDDNRIDETPFPDLYAFFDISRFFGSGLYCKLQNGMSTENIKYVTIKNGFYKTSDNKPHDREIIGWIVRVLSG